MPKQPEYIPRETIQRDSRYRLPNPKAAEELKELPRHVISGTSDEETFVRGKGFLETWATSWSEEAPPHEVIGRDTEKEQLLDCTQAFCVDLGRNVALRMPPTKNMHIYPMQKAGAIRKCLNMSAWATGRYDGGNSHIVIFDSPEIWATLGHELLHAASTCTELHFKGSLGWQGRFITRDWSGYADPSTSKSNTLFSEAMTELVNQHVIRDYWPSYEALDKPETGHRFGGTYSPLVLLLDEILRTAVTPTALFRDIEEGFLDNRLDELHKLTAVASREAMCVLTQMEAVRTGDGSMDPQDIAGLAYRLKFERLGSLLSHDYDPRKFDPESWGVLDWLDDKAASFRR